MKTIDTVLFDWDGTLLDSAAAAFQTFQRALRELGIELRADVYRSIYAPNWYRMYEALGLARDLWEKADQLWLQFNREYPASLMTGAFETVHELSGRRYILGVVTSGSRCRVVREMAEHKLSEFFQVVVCNEDTLQKKPSPEGLEKAMRTLDREPEFCCYVGDTPEDVQMGKNARVLTFSVEGGYPRHCRELDAFVHLPSISCLLEHLPPR
jgi:HAD superfamily hydrolase (TIGR01549 family)